MDRLALTDQRAVEYRVEYLAARVIAIGQVEIIGANPFTPIGQRKAEIAAFPGRNHQRVRARSGIVGIGARAACIAFGIGDPAGEANRPLGIGVADRQRFARATVGHAHFGTADGLGAVERCHPGEACAPTPFEVDAEVGDECRTGDIAWRVATEQGGPQPGAGELDHVKAGLGQRDADNLEILALARQRHAERLACPARQNRL